MSDEQIITLYWERSVSAIVETAAVGVSQTLCKL